MIIILFDLIQGNNPGQSWNSSLEFKMISVLELFVVELVFAGVTCNNSLVALFQNARASYDFSSNDPYPYPRYTDDWFNR